MSLLSSPSSFIFTPATSNGRLPPRQLTRTWFRRPLLHSLSRPLSSTAFNPRPLLCRCSSMPLVESFSASQLQDSLLYSRAYWVSKSVIAWNVDIEGGSFYLYASRTAALVITGDGIEGQDVKVKLEEDCDGLPANVIEKFPHIRDYRAFKVPPALDAESAIKCQLAISVFNSDGKCCSATGLQLPGILDELFSYTGPLGAVFSEENVSLYLWAPTAQVVLASIYRDPSGRDPLETVQLEEVKGVWSTNGPKNWEGCFYVYEVSVYNHSTLKIEKCIANDPYARGLSSDARRTLLVNLDSASLKPEGWDNLADEKPELLSFSDISIYELHIRDFSANDHTLEPEFRGGYLAFTSQDSAGVLHLKKLSEAGLTHVHLLPAFQFGGVDDEKEKWKCVDDRILEMFPPDSIEQQAEITSIQDEDGYNWGYNPVLWGVPKGSYATNPRGSCRVIEFRKMVQALNSVGLRVVLDVVYNHVYGNGPFDENSVLDKIVPGYYLRRNTDGFIENSAAVNNTASEHLMVERLILDDLLCWAINYKDLVTRRMIGRGRRTSGGLYMLEVEPLSLTCSQLCPLELHCQLSHPALSSLQLLCLSLSSLSHLFCELCQMAKHYRRTYVPNNNKRTSTHFSLVH